MKNLIGIILLAVLCYYGVTYYQHMNDPRIKVEERLAPYLSEWVDMMEKENIEYEGPFHRLSYIMIVPDSVVLESMARHGFIGESVAISDPAAQSIIISETQASKGEYTLKATLWHELGHYIYELNHVEGYYLMNEYSYDEKEYKEDWDKFKDNYLLRCKQNEYSAFY